MVNQMFRLLSVIIIFVLTTLVAQPSYSDDVTINLNPSTPYVDVPFTVTEPVDATISTVTGTPQTNPGFIDSWIELWQDLNKLRADDDSAHSASNMLASIINMPLQVGDYFIRATSFAHICCNAYPTGTYLLSTNLIIVSTPAPTPTPILPTPTETATPSPTPTQTSSSPTPEPTPEPSSPSPSPTDTPQPTESPEVPVGPTQEPDEPDPVPSVELILPSELPTPDVQDTLEVIVDESFNDFPSSLEPNILFEPSLEIDERESVLEFLPEFSLESLQETFQQISETITAALSTVSNLGSEFTPEERQQAQQVVLGAIIVTQLSTARRIK
jgi:hypothetical protein